jgi:hypothetical protein
VAVAPGPGATSRPRARAQHPLAAPPGRGPLSPRARCWRRMYRICRIDGRSAAIAPLSSGADGALDHPASTAQTPAPGWDRAVCSRSPIYVCTLPILAFTMTDPCVRVGVIPAFTFDRSWCSPGAATRRWRRSSSGSVISPVGRSVPVCVDRGDTPTFAIFVRALGPVSFDAAGIACSCACPRRDAAPLHLHRRPRGLIKPAVARAEPGRITCGRRARWRICHGSQPLWRSV